MSSDKEQRNEGIVPFENRGLTKYSSELIQRGLILAKELDQAAVALDISGLTNKTSKPQQLIWKCLHTLRGHSDGVYSVAISPDGQTLASCGKDKNIKIWDLNTGELLSTLTGHSDDVYSVRFSPNGQILASSSGDKTVKVWKWHTKELLCTLVGHSDNVYSVRFSPNGQILASSSGDKKIKIWDLSTKTQLNTFSSNLEDFTAIKYYNEQTFFTDFCKEIKDFNLSWEPLDIFFEEIYLAATLSQDGQILLVGDGSRIKLWNLNTGELQRSLGNSELLYNKYNQYHSVAISIEGRTIAGGDEEGTIKIFALDTGQLLYNLSGHSKSVFSIAFSHDEQILVSGSRDGIINIWQKSPLAESDATTYQTHCWSCINTLTGYPERILSVDISPDGQIIACGRCNKTIKIWNLKTGELLCTLKGHSDCFDSVVISNAGEILVSGSFSKIDNFYSIKIWNLNTGELIHTLDDGRAQLFAISSDGQTLASSRFSFLSKPDLEIDVWSLQTGQRLRTLFYPSNFVPDDKDLLFFFPIKSLAFSPNGKILACGTEDGKIHLWDLHAGEIIHTFTGHLFEVVSVAFSPDGQLIASSSEDATVKLWNLQTKKVIRTFPAGLGSVDDLCSVTSVAFSPDGQTLASVSSLYTTIWNLSTGEQICILDSCLVAFSPDGQTLITTPRDGTIEIWQLSPVMKIEVTNFNN